MLIAAGLVAASEKHAKERKKKAERQGRLTVGDSSEAKRAFETQTSSTAASESAGTDMVSADVKYEDPNDIQATSPDADSPSIYSPKPDLHDVRQTSSYGVTSPVESERGILSLDSPYSTMPALSETALHRAGSTASTAPPPYSSHGSTDKPQGSPSVRSSETQSLNRMQSDATSTSLQSTNSKGTHAIRIKTRGPDLKSGFPYHPALFDLRVRPEQWETFTAQLIEATKVSAADNAKVWSAATGVALTGHIIPAIFVGQSMKRAAYERSVREGLEDTSDGSLGDKLRLWNEEYFTKNGLFVHLELSESSMKKDGKEKTFRKPTAFFSKGEERDRKKEERKFVIVVTKLDAAGEPSEAIREVAGTEGMPVEIGSSDDPSSSSAVELPAEIPPAAVELPAEIPAELPAGDTHEKEKSGLSASEGIVEMSSDNTVLLEKMHLNETASPSSGY